MNDRIYILSVKPECQAKMCIQLVKPECQAQMCIQLVKPECQAQMCIQLVKPKCQVQRCIGRGASLYRYRSQLFGRLWVRLPLPTGQFSEI